MTKCWVRGINMWVPLFRYLTLIRSFCQVCQAARKIYLYCWCSFLHRNVTGWARYEMFYYYTIRIFLISPLLVLHRRILGSFKAGPVKNNMRLQTEIYVLNWRTKAVKKTQRVDKIINFALQLNMATFERATTYLSERVVSLANETISFLSCSNRRLRVVPIFPQG